MKANSIQSPDRDSAPPSRAGPAVLEQLLGEIEAIAFDQGKDTWLLEPDDFECWSGGGASYLEARFSSSDLPEIDLSTRDGRIFIRILWRSADEMCRGTSAERGGIGV